MRRIVLWFASTVTVVVLLFGYHTSTNDTSDAQTVASSGSTAGGTALTTKTTLGSVAQTRWGPVQVQITTSGHTITEVTVVQQPDGNQRDVEINEQALPTLISETKDASSADIDMVSGATVTSQGYLESLQAALDSAGF
ncbi:FMN-binding protein [uncultured Friedmanniella sp.]|uniref:FMN-binding protein n=1 Tax=uncultured Friedmanniella sp. TaxID=335381 RepID=UPI0035CB06A9